MTGTVLPCTGKPVIALGKFKILFEDHHDRADERVVLALRILGEVVGKFIGERFGAPLDDVVEIRSAELETVLVRGYGAIARDGHGFFVDLALERSTGFRSLDPNFAKTPLTAPSTLFSNRSRTLILVPFCP